MAKLSAPQAITIERDNITYQGHYTIEGKMVRVSCPLGSKVTQIGGSTAESIARILLAEIVNDAKR